MKPIHHYRLACLRAQERRLQGQLDKVRGQIGVYVEDSGHRPEPWVKRFISWWRAA